MDIILFGFKLGLGFALGWHLVAVPALVAVLLLERWTGSVLLRSLMRRVLRRHKEEPVKVTMHSFDDVVVSNDGATVSGVNYHGGDLQYRYSRDAGYSWSDLFSFDMLPGDVAELWNERNERFGRDA